MEGIEQIKESINTILEMLKRPEDGLWDTADIAAYAKLTKKNVQNHVVTRPDFPKPVDPGTGAKRWNRDEVKQWVLRRRKN